MCNVQTKQAAQAPREISWNAVNITLQSLDDLLHS